MSGRGYSALRGLALTELGPSSLRSDVPGRIAVRSGPPVATRFTAEAAPTNPCPLRDLGSRDFSRDLQASAVWGYSVSGEHDSLAEQESNGRMTESANLVILFADICGSTRLYEMLGDTQASAAINTCLKAIEQVGNQHEGELVKTIGDEILMLFPQPDQAATAARAMHEAARALPAGPNQVMALHIGFHIGSGLRENNDVLGDGVNVAARLVGLAKAGQTLTSAATLRQLSNDWLNLARQVDSTLVRGKTGQITLYELLWQPEDATRMVDRSRNTQPKVATRLRLRHRDREVELGPDHPIVTLGRADSCDLVIKNELVSRLHARLEYRKDRFLLTDQSTNGTYICPERGTPLFVRRDTQAIQGVGLIGLGETVSDDSPDGIRFTELG
jgi:adenylate cyclase